MNKNASFVQKRLSRKKFPAQISIWLPIFMPCSLARSGWIVISLNIDFYIGLWDSVLFHIFLFFHSLYFLCHFFYVCLCISFLFIYLLSLIYLSISLCFLSVCFSLSLSQCLYLFSISISFNIQHSVSPFHTKISRKKVLLFCLSVFLFADSYTLTSFHFCILFYSF